MPVLSDRHNIIVIADEAHRSQYAEFAQNLTTALPNATRIGFTGTPIERDDRSTQLTFGPYVSIYNITRAVSDGATVPIYYESRAVPLDVDNDELLEAVEQTLQAETTEAANKLITAEAKLDRLVGSEGRLNRIAQDIAGHYAERSKTLEGKAMVVGMTRLICAKLTDRLREHLGDAAVERIQPCVADRRAAGLRRRSADCASRTPRRPGPGAPRVSRRVHLRPALGATGADAPRSGSADSARLARA